MKLRFVLIFFGLLTLHLTIQAEGRCPPGYYPWDTPGVSGCIPIPGYNQQQQQTTPPRPLGRWESRWGAIATDEPHGIVGSVTGLSSRQAAERGAMADCAAKGGQHCKLETWYSNGCAALVVGDHVYNVTAEASLEQATEQGMKICSRGGVTGCHVHFSACSLPALIR